MTIWHNFVDENGSRYRFRQKHSYESYAGRPGILAFTAISNFAVVPLYVEATDNLVCVDQKEVSTHPKYLQLRTHTKIGLAVLTMKGSTRELRENIARSIKTKVVNQLS